MEELQNENEKVFLQLYVHDSGDGARSENLGGQIVMRRIR